MFRYSPLVLALVAGTVQAQWYETTGQAMIRSGDSAKARQQATEDAVKRAMLFAGVSVRSLQEVTDGLLTQERLQVQATGEVQQVQLVSETTRNGYYEVTIRADIEPQKSSCPTLAYKKKLLITPFRLKEAEQAVIGDLFNLGTVSGELFTDKLKEITHSSWPAPLNNPLDVRALTYAERKAIQQQYGARYILTARLDDVSLGNREGTNWSFWNDPDRERFYHLNVLVFDLAEERVVLEQKYQTSAVWTYRKTTKLDPKNHRFWQTDYGQAAERVLNAAAMDVEEAIRCEPLQAEIVDVDGPQVLLSIGKAHGVKVGDTFKLLHKREMPDRFGRAQSLLADTSITVKVTQLSSEAAWAETVDNAMLANIQPGDLANPTTPIVDEFEVEDAEEDSGANASLP